MNIKFDVYFTVKGIMTNVINQGVANVVVRYGEFTAQGRSQGRPGMSIVTYGPDWNNVLGEVILDINQNVAKWVIVLDIL